MKLKTLLAVAALSFCAAGLAQAQTHHTPKPAKAGTSAATPLPRNAEKLSHGRFESLIVFHPKGTPQSFALFLSDTTGWNTTATMEAQALVAKGALVVGIDTAQMIAAMEKDDGDCVYPDGDLENLGHFVQAYYKLPTYLPPVLVGEGAGATLAYASMIQAPPDTFTGVLSLDFCSSLKQRKPLCVGSGIEFTPRANNGGVDFLPAKKLPNPWLALQRADAAACPAGDSSPFLAKVPGVSRIELSKGAPVTVPLQTAFTKLTATPAARTVPPPPTSLTGLPIIVVAAKPGVPPADTFALLISGDGGWAGIDKEVAASLSAKGVTVIGLDSLRYFWAPRTPDSVAKDVDRILRYYLATLKKSRALLIGYSQGADVLPFALNRLPATTRAQIALSAVMGLSDNALFEFHLSNWVGNTDEGIPTLPEVARVHNIVGAMPVLCIYGQDDGEALCPKLDPQQFRIVKLKGGHHFGGDYDRVAQEIIASIPPLPAPH